MRTQEKIAVCRYEKHYECLKLTYLNLKMSVMIVAEGLIPVNTLYFN